MAQEFDLIVEMLGELKRANNNNSESFDKLLTSISKKLDTIDRNTETTELIRTYLSDLAKSTEEKYSSTISKFTDIEKAIKAIFVEQDEHARNSDMQELLDIFSKNMNNYYSEARQQKSILNGIEEKITSISSDKTDKEDILRTITLLRTDFENVNHSYKSIIDSVNTELKNILSNVIKFDQTTVNSQISAQLEVVSRATNDIISYLDSMDKRDANLEKILLNVATNESLKLTKEVIDSIIEKTDSLTNKVNSLADKDDIQDMKTAASYLNQKIDETATKELFTKLSTTTESIVSETESIKQTLAKVTTNIDNLPDIETLETSLQKVFNKLKTLNKDVERANSKQDILDLNNKLETLNSEFSTIKNIVIDLNESINSKVLSAINDISFEQESFEIKNHISKMLGMMPQKEDIDKLLENDELSSNLIQDIVKKADILADRLDSLPTHEDMETLNNNQLSLVENLQAVANKDDIDAILNQGEEIDNKISKINFDNEFENLYDKSTSIENWLKNSNIKENTEEIATQLPKKAEQKEILEVLQTLEKMAKEIDEISQNSDVKKVNRTVAEVYQLIEDLKNDFINTTEMHNDSVIVNLSELQKSISSVVTAEEFSNFAEDLKEFVEKTIEENKNLNSDILEIKDYQQSILNKIEDFNTSEISDAINEKVEGLDKKLLTLSDYLNNLPSVENSELAKNISELKEILTTKNFDISELGENNDKISSSIEEYLKEIKELCSKDNTVLDENTTEKFDEIKESLHHLLAVNENSFAEVIEHLGQYSQPQEDTAGTLLQNEMASTLSEIIELKERIIALANTFNELNFPTSTPESEITDFVSSKLEELGLSMENLTDSVGSQFQTGFAYNAELLEEKANVISELIKELRHENTANIELYERLTQADNKILDVIQELQLVNTDIINNLNDKNETLLNELAPIKDAITSFSGADINSNNGAIKNQLDELHTIIKENISNLSNETAQKTLDKLDVIYNKVSAQITESEHNLRDFILGDIDSVIIKIDSLKNELEDCIEGFVPPDATQMKEFNDFLKQIHEFKKDFDFNFTGLAEDIKTSVEEQLEVRHQEIKSMLSIAINNDEILAAIDDLKNSFKTGAIQLINSNNQDFDENSDDFEINDYEKEFEPDKMVEIVTGLKNDFNHFSELVKDLSEQNPEIEEIINLIQEKMQSLSLATPIQGTNSEIPEIVEDDNSNEGKVLVGEGDFDFLKALNYLKSDIQNLKNDVKEIIPQEEQVKLSHLLENSENLTNLDIVENFSQKLDKLEDKLSQNQWLEEIKSYLSNDKVQSLLEEINNKIDILTLTDSSDWVEEIKNAIKGINSNDIPAGTDSTEIQTMLNLINNKIDILANTDNSADLDNINDLKNSLDTIETKIDVIAATEPQTDFDSIEEIKDSLSLIETKIDTIADSDTSFDIDDIKYSLENIDKKLDEDNQISDENFTEILETINHKIDNISAEDLSKSIEDVKSLITAQTDYINSLEKTSKTEAVKKCLEELSTEVNNINDNGNVAQIQKTIREMKESIMAAVVTILDQVSFIEETEEIKDFVEEKTDEINQSLIEVTNQLKQITNANEEPDYTYSMQDIESDLAKLRMALNTLQNDEKEVQTGKLTSILENINQVGNSVVELQNSLSKEEVFGLRNQFEQINSDILNLSDITNQLIIKSGESYNALNTTFEDFSKLITDQLSLKVDTMTKLLENSNASDKVMRQALIYMGEWIDSASESMNKISTNSDEIIDIKSAIEGLKKSAPQQTEILNSIEEKFDEQQERLSFFEKQISKLGSIEERFEEQQERIDRLEMSLEKILSAVEDIDDSKVTRKIDKIDKQIAKLSTNIEKLTSYVD